MKFHLHQIFAVQYNCNTLKIPKITEIDENFIFSLYEILQVLSSHESIDVDKFNSFCLRTAEKYASLYGWYNMTPSLRKVSFHGKNIIENQLLPIGYYSEETQESFNKLFEMPVYNILEKHHGYLH